MATILQASNNLHMSIFGHNNVINTKRLEKTGNKEEYPSTFILENVDCYLEPISLDVQTIIDDQAAYNAFKCYFDDEQDIRIGDLVIDENSIEYTVKGVSPFLNNREFTSPYVEALLVKKYDPNSI